LRREDSRQQKNQIRSEDSVTKVYIEAGNAVASNFTQSAKESLSTLTKESRPELDDLLVHATQAAKNSYSPYSHFRVGAALKLTNGEIVTGTNVENVSYGLTICAERSALVSAVSQFGPDLRIEAVAVANLNQAASPPCGACRQVLAEFVLPGAPVIFPAADGQRVMPFTDLLPLAFDMKL